MYSKTWINKFKMDFNGVNLRGVNLRGADLTEINFCWANLTRVDLSLADLSGADLIRADLREANLTRADLSGANLGWVNFTSTKFPETDKFLNCPWSICHIRSDFIRIGCEYHTVEEWNNFTDEEIDKMDPYKALEWWKFNKPIVMFIANQL